jgi:PIN domain nuclease of toxin-antitoxin system
VNILLDTQALLWFLGDDPRLTPTAKALIEDAENWKLVSVASCWEIAIKAGLKRLDLGDPASSFLTRELATNHFDLLGIDLAHATLVETLPPHHKDPFDRLLVAQALIDQLPLLSSDEVLDQYGVTRLWKWGLACHSTGFFSPGSSGHAPLANQGTARDQGTFVRLVTLSANSRALVSSLGSSK